MVSARVLALGVGALIIISLVVREEFKKRLKL